MIVVVRVLGQWYNRGDSSWKLGQWGPTSMTKCYEPVSMAVHLAWDALGKDLGETTVYVAVMVL